MTTITLNNHGLEAGDKIGIYIDNGFWKVFYHWVFQKNLRRSNLYTITNTTINNEDEYE